MANPKWRRAIAILIKGNHHFRVSAPPQTIVSSGFPTFMCNSFHFGKQNLHCKQLITLCN